MNDYRFGNVINPDVYYDYYSIRSMKFGFRYPYLRLIKHYFNKKEIQIKQ